MKSKKYDFIFVAYLTSLLVSYLLAYVVGATALGDPINTIGPVGLIIGCLLMAYKLVRLDTVNIWAPFPWFLVAVSVFIGFGPLLYIYGNPETIAYVQRKWLLVGSDLTFVNFLNFVGVYIVTAVVCLSPAKFYQMRYPGLSRNRRVSPKSVTKVLLVTGAIIKYGLVLPHEFGLSSFVLPGFLYALDSLMKLALFLLGYMSSRYRKGWTVLLVVFCVAEFSVDFLRFSKTEILMTVIMPFLGSYFYSRKVKTLIYGAIVIVVGYVAYSPIVHSGRAGIINLNGNFYTATLSERVGVASESLNEYSATRDRADPVQRGWTRLNYADVQAFAVHRYNTSYPGDSLKNALIVFIPRVIWPEKPIISSTGQDFTMLYSGYRTSSTGLGVFAEAYWNGGWLLVILVSVLIGVLFIFITKTSLTHLRTNNFIFLPVAFLGMKIGTNVSGWLVTSYIGAFAIYIAYYFVASVIVTRTK